MKKILLMLLCGALMLSVFACDKPKKSSNPPKMDPPEWEELADEYDDWSRECVNYQASFRKAPDNPVNQNMVKKWPRDIKDWNVRIAEMLDELKDFPNEKKAFIEELKKVSKRLNDADVVEVTADDVEAFLDEYNAWVEGYLAFLEEHKDNKVSEAYKSGLNNLIFETAVWWNKINHVKLGITDAELLDAFSDEAAKLSDKVDYE